MKASEGSFPVFDIPPESLPEWPEDLRVSRGGCSRKSGYMCMFKRTTHVPVDVKHYCDDFLPRIKRLPGAA